MADLFQAVRRGTVAEVLGALRGNWRDLRDLEGGSLLHEAIGFERPDLAIELLARGIDPNVQKESGDTALHYAAEHGFVSVVHALLAKGADPRLVNKHGNSPLWTAVFHSKQAPELPGMLVRAGADPRATNKAGRSPLDLARSFGEHGASLVADLSS